MQGIETIIGRIQADTQAEIDKLNAETARKVEKIRAGYSARAEREAADILARGETAAAERESRLVSAAQMDARKMTLSAKQEMLDRAFQLALDTLLRLPEADYIALLAKLALSASATGKENLILNAADRARVGEAVCAEANKLLQSAGKLASLKLAQETRPIRGGLLLSDGAVEVNCALETLIRLSRSELTGEVTGLLFD